jgi:predicted transcriptional regulator
VCYTASMRPGRTKTTSFSLDEATLKNLKALAERRHKGNVSALLAEIASREAKFIAAEALFESYGVPPLDEEAIERIAAEWRGEAPPRKKRRRAA